MVTFLFFLLSLFNLSSGNRCFQAWRSEPGGVAEFALNSEIPTAAMASEILILALILMTVQFGDAIKCYHCYDMLNETSVSGEMKSRDWDFGEKFVKCDKDRKQWNSWDCPQEWPVCVITSAKVGAHTEVVRTCAVEGFCSKYEPPKGETGACHECKTNLCNDYPDFPDTPESPLFVFNVNINLRVRKFPAVA